MSDFKNKPQSRRKFLSRSLIAVAGMATGEAAAQSLKESGETVKMLTQDGKLVEIDKALLSPQSLKKQASKKDILRWIHPDKEEEAYHHTRILKT